MGEKKKKSLLLYILIGAIGVWVIVGIVAGLVWGVGWFIEKIIEVITIPGWVGQVAMITFIGVVFGCLAWARNKEEK